MNTPGPWEVRQGHGCWHAVSQDGAFSTGCISFDGLGLGNAQLIAAAPDMLAALRLIAESRCERLTAGNCWEHPEWTVDAPYLAERVCNTCIARRAIAKAEGRQP